jgi:hypothetical protein
MMMDSDDDLMAENNSWNRRGVHVCVSIFTSLVIHLSALLIYFFYKDLAFAAYFWLKSSKANKKRIESNKQEENTL